MWNIILLKEFDKFHLQQQSGCKTHQLKDYEDEKNLELFKNLRVQDNQSGKPYPFEHCWEESLKQKDKNNKNEIHTRSAPLPIIPGHAKQKGGKSPKSPKSGASIIVGKSPTSYTSKSPKSPKSGASLASMTSAELKELKEDLATEDKCASKNSSDKKPHQVNFKIDCE